MINYADTKANPAPVLLDAIKVPAGAFKPGSAVTYMVIEKKAPKNAGDKRAEARRRTRLRSGKVLDARNKFLIECQVHDRSEHGARLRLVADVSAPRQIRVFDDEAKILREAEIVWRNKHEMGVRFIANGDIGGLRGSERATLAGKYYAMAR